MRLVAASWRGCAGAPRRALVPPVLLASRSMVIKRRWRNFNQDDDVSVEAELDDFCRAHPINEKLLRLLGDRQEVMLIGETGGIIKERCSVAEALAVAREKRLDVTVVQNRELTAAQRGQTESVCCGLFLLGDRGGQGAHLQDSGL
jgi:hypothetical protein